MAGQEQVEVSWWVKGHIPLGAAAERESYWMACRRFPLLPLCPDCGLADGRHALLCSLGIRLDAEKLVHDRLSEKFPWAAAQQQALAWSLDGEPCGASAMHWRRVAEEIDYQRVAQQRLYDFPDPKFSPTAKVRGERDSYGDRPADDE